jgi:protein-S-isoprenylcysteine O-methyltransferase Ste14
MASSIQGPRRRGPQYWINALLPSVIWLGGAGFYAYLRKPAGVSILEVRTDAPGWLGAGLVGAGFALHCWSVVVLAGHGTAPDPAGTLAMTGPYRFVRNPIYLAGITLLAGIGLLYGPWRVADLAVPVALFVYFHLAVVLVEEPALRSRFCESYGAYCQRVSRWLPRLAPGVGAAQQGEAADGASHRS